MKVTTKAPPATRLPGDAPITAKEVVAQLEEAGRTLMRMPMSGHSTGARNFWPEILPDPNEAYGWTDAEIRPSMPSAAEITRMDVAWRYLAHIPHDRYVLRRIVAARALVHPVTDRHIYAWRRLGTLLGCHHMAAQRWHKQGVEIITASLNRVRKIAA